MTSTIIMSSSFFWGHAKAFNSHYWKNTISSDIPDSIYSSVDIDTRFVGRYSVETETKNPSLSSSQRTDDYPFDLSNDYLCLYPNDTFEISLVTYTGIESKDYISQYVSRWSGPIIIVMYYHVSELPLLESCKNIIANISHVSIIPFLLQNNTIPINRLKNIGIDRNSTCLHQVPFLTFCHQKENLYSVLKNTGGYLWRDPYFIGVIPAFEWSHEVYDSATNNYERFSTFPEKFPDLIKCVKDFTCRPVQTTTIPMQFLTFSMIHFRNMNCIDRDSEVYYILKKTSVLPRYDERITIRGYDNIDYVEKIRLSITKFGLLCDEFLFQIPGIGIDSAKVYNNIQNPKLKAQFELLKEEYISASTSFHPTVMCDEIDGNMFSWIGFHKYEWMPEEVINGKFYPKIAVKRGRTMKLVVK